MKRRGRRAVLFGLLLIVVLVPGLAFLGPRYFWRPAFDLEDLRQAQSVTIFYKIFEGGRQTERQGTISSPEELRAILGAIQKTAEFKHLAVATKPSQLFDISGWLSYWFSRDVTMTFISDRSYHAKIVLANGSVKELSWSDPEQLYEHGDCIMVQVSPSFERRIADVFLKREGKDVWIRGTFYPATKAPPEQ
jgi:hypothetical protein